MCANRLHHGDRRRRWRLGGLVERSELKKTGVTSRAAAVGIRPSSLTCLWGVRESEMAEEAAARCLGRGERAR